MNKSKYIQNKKITIIKKNTFTQNYALFRKCFFNVPKNNLYEEISLPDIVNAITYATKINLVLANDYVPSNIRSEIEWVNKYIKIHLIAKDKKILNSFDNLRFDTAKIDKNIDFNYLHIEGKTKLDVIFDDYYYPSDSSINYVLFENKTITGNIDFLNGSKEIYAIDQVIDDSFIQLIKFCKERKIIFNYVFSLEGFNKSNYLKLLKQGIKIYIAEIVSPGLYAFYKDYTIKAFHLVNNTFYVGYEINDMLDYVSKTYESFYLDGNQNTDVLKKITYICYDKKISLLKMEKLNIVNIDVPIKTMEDFYNETFDCSIVEEHNQYSGKYFNTEYVFNLIPPLFNDAFKISSIYINFNSIKDEFKKINFQLLVDIENEYKSFYINDCGILSCIDEIQKFHLFIDNLYSNKYSNYKQEIIHIYDVIKVSKASILNYCETMFNQINKGSNNTKFTQFDDEINGYKETIEKKRHLIANGIDKISNSRRIQLLEHKIEDLEKLKLHFESNSSLISNKESLIFMDSCKQLLDGTYHKFESSESIKNVIKVEESPVNKLYNYVEKYVYQFDKLLNNLINIVESFMQVDIPENYVVYEKDKKRYIQIENLQEYIDTLPIQQKYNIFCVARR